MVERELTIPTQRERMLTFRSGGWVILLSLVLTMGVGVWNLWPVLATKFRPAVGDGVHVESYGFDLRGLTVPWEKLVAAGVGKDQIRALGIRGRAVEMWTVDDVRRIRERERVKFLVDTDRVIGVEIAGETRAYPLRVLVQHEICNDVVGGVPVAVTYSPLCDSVVVFDRRVGGETLEFGVSGLLVNSNLVTFDRRDGGKGESLWSQLWFKALAGPQTGTELKRVEHALAEWGTWIKLHPDTKVAAGEAALRPLYLKEPYQSYDSSNVLKFPVEPLWAGDKKMRVVALPGDAEQWRVVKAGEQGERRDGVEAFAFAWYAMWPGSDFTQVK